MFATPCSSALYFIVPTHWLLINNAAVLWRLLKICDETKEEMSSGWYCLHSKDAKTLTPSPFLLLIDTFERPFSLGLTILHLLPTKALMAFVPDLFFKNTCALNSSEEEERHTPVRHHPPPSPVVGAQRTRVRKR